MPIAVRNKVTLGRSLEEIWTPKKNSEALNGAFFWLTSFFFVYCARPTDLIPGLSVVPLAKITGGMAALSLIAAAGKTPRKFKDRPKEANYLLGLIAVLTISGFLSPIWKGGAVSKTIDFAKIYIAWILSFLLITTLGRLRRIIYIQSASVALVSFAAIAKGHSIPRLNGVIGGFYSNPNDMAFGIVLSLPFCIAFLLSAKGALRRIWWCLAVVTMLAALLLTASRAGFIDLVVSGVFCLWNFGVKGKRLYLIAATFLLAVLLIPLAGKTLFKRFAVISGGTVNSRIEVSAYGSYEERKILMERAVDAIIHYPILGVGVDNFAEYSGIWKDVHMSYLQITAEGGIPSFILYIMFFACGFSNLRHLNKRKESNPQAILFRGALQASLVGFVLGACFAPEAYQYFPYFTVCYTSVLLAMSKENVLVPATTAKDRTAPQVMLAGAY